MSLYVELIIRALTASLHVHKVNGSASNADAQEVTVAVTGEVDAGNNDDADDDDVVELTVAPSAPSAAPKASSGVHSCPC